tara:strand:- start:143 stop:751 length:609 start_codon:yes stop_codon:yes gene_type:complete
LKKNKISKNWVIKKNRDLSYKKSKLFGFRSRSAFKLIELEKKFKFLKENTSLLDLGCSPGGWSQVARKKIIKGKIMSIDIKNMENIDKVNFLQSDLFNPNIEKIVLGYFNKKIDVVVSDMAANTTGNKNLDSYKTGELCLRAMQIAKNLINNNGVFISKVFMGAIFLEIQEKAKRDFKKVVKFKPLSSKSDSKEIYIYCKGV